MDNKDLNNDIAGSVFNFKMPLLMMAVLFVGYMLLNKDNQPKKKGNTNKRIEALISSPKLAVDAKYYTNQPFDKNRASAVSHLKCNEFKKIIQSVTKIEDTNKTFEDYYYLGYACLRNGQAGKAKENLSKALSMSKGREKILPTAKLFQAIAFIQTKEISEARKLHDGLKKGSWHEKKLKTILSTLD